MGGGYCENGRGGVYTRRKRVGGSRLTSVSLESLRDSVMRVPLVSTQLHFVREYQAMGVEVFRDDVVNKEVEERVKI